MKLGKISKLSVLASHWLGYGALSVLASACTMHSHGLSGATHSIEIALPQAVSHSSGAVHAMSEVPTALSSFTCYMVNITGSAIPMDPRLQCSNPQDGLGVFVGFIQAGASSATLNVPSGQVDIQLIGIDNPGGGCPDLSSTLSAASLHGLGDLYLLASDSVNISGATSVDMTASFTAGSTQTVLQSCTGPELVFNTSGFPTSGTSGSALASSLQVQVQNSSGALVSTATNSVTLAAFTDADCNTPANGSLSAAANAQAASGGVASFSNVTYTGGTGTIYLGATASGINPGCSSAITISPGASQLAFTQAPSSSAASGQAFSTQPIVQIQNSSNQLVSTASATITLTAYSGSSCGGTVVGTLTGNSMAATGGQAQFSVAAKIPCPRVAS